MKKIIIILVFLVSCVSFLNAELNFDFAFSFAKIDIEDELINLQLFDIDNDGIEEIITMYVNQNGIWRILVINKDGNIVTNHYEYYSTNGFVPKQFYLYEYCNEVFLVISYSINHNHPQLDSIKTEIYDFANYNALDSLTIEIENYTISSELEICDISCIDGNGIMKIIVGYKKGNFDSNYLNFLNRMIIIEFNGQKLCYLNEINESGEVIYGFSNTTIGHTASWWGTGSSCGGDEHYYVKNLQGVQFYHKATSWYDYAHSGSYSSGEFKQFCLLSSDYIDYQNLGPIIYTVIWRSQFQYEHITVCFTTDLSNIVWEITEMLSSVKTIHSSSNFSYNEDNHFIIYSTTDSLTILDRVTGNIVLTESSSFTPFALRKTINDKLLLFEDQDSIYNVYSNDPIYPVNDEGLLIDKLFSNLTNSPNPFHSSTTFSFSSKNPIQNAEITIYNVKGQLVKQFKIQNLNLKINEIDWDGKDKNGHKVAPGVYLYQLCIDGEYKAERKCLLIE